MDARIARSLHDRLIALAAATPDVEICGLLLGRRTAATTTIDAITPARNVAPHPADSFELDPATLFVALRADRAGGAALLGHYHSHPLGPASPSPRDAAAAEPGRLWLIVGAGEVRAWFAGPGGAFAAVPLHIDA